MISGLRSRKIDIGAVGGATHSLVGEEAGRVIRVYKLFMTFDAAETIRFQDGTADLTPAHNYAQNEKLIFEFDGVPWFETTAGNALRITRNGTVELGGIVWYTIS